MTICRVFRASSFVPGRLAVVGACLVASACGYIADKEMIVIAVLDGESIRRGHLNEYLRGLEDDERPLIQNKGDLMQALNVFIELSVKADLAKQLQAEGKIEISRDAARAEYFRRHPEHRDASKIYDPKLLQMTQAELNAVLDAIEFGVDDAQAVLAQEEAWNYMTREFGKAGRIQVSPDEVASAYALRKNELRQFEFIEFIGLRFPATKVGLEQAGDARRRVAGGETFDAVLEAQLKVDPNRAMRSGFENNPRSQKFRLFWHTVTGCAAGDILGPVLLPPYEALAPGPGGEMQAQQMPAAYVVFEVLDHTPERLKTLEEAKLELAFPLLKRKAMDLLREQHGVEIFEDKIPDPAGYGGQFEGQFIETGR